MSLLRSGLLSLLLCCTALALPKGEWFADFYGEVGTIVITESQFSFKLADGKGQGGFAGPLAEVREAQGEQPGRLVVGPVKDGSYPFEVVYFYEPTGPRGTFYCQPEGYPTLQAAQASKAEFEPYEASVFLAREFYQQVNALPPLPIPDKAQLVSLLEEALRRQKASPNLDPNTLMETLMIDQGFHPTKSREPFEKAVQDLIGDPDVSRLLDELDPQNGDEDGEKQE